MLPDSEAASLETLVRDIAAVARFQDRAAFARLFAHFAPRVKAYLLRLGADQGQAEDLMQDVMLTVWRKAPAYDAKLASLDSSLALAQSVVEKLGARRATLV